MSQVVHQLALLAHVRQENALLQMSPGTRLEDHTGAVEALQIGRIGAVLATIQRSQAGECDGSDVQPHTPFVMID